MGHAAILCDGSNSGLRVSRDSGIQALRQCRSPRATPTARATRPCSARQSAPRWTGLPTVCPIPRRLWSGTRASAGPMRELSARVDAFAAGLLALGLERGDRVGIWSPNYAEWVVTQFATAKAGLILVNINPAYRAHELQYALNKVGCKALITAPRVQDQRLPRDAARPGAGARRCHARASCTPRAARPAHRDPHRRQPLRDGCSPSTSCRARRRTPSADRLAELDRPSCSSTIRSTSSSPAAPPAARRARRSRTTTSSTTATSSARRMRFSRGDRLCIPVPLYHCFGMVLGNLACLTHGAAMVYPSEGFDPLAVLEAVAGRALHGALRRADDVHRRAGPPGVRELRPLVAAHRHHGRLALPDRGDEAGHRRDAHARGDDRLRHDRDEPGQLPELGRRPARAARLHRRPHPAARGGEDRRRATAASCRAARRRAAARAATR